MVVRHLNEAAPRQGIESSRDRQRVVTGRVKARSPTETRYARNASRKADSGKKQGNSDSCCGVAAL